MAWLAVDKNGSECIHYSFPSKRMECWDNFEGIIIPLPDGTIERLIGRPLTWEDEPVELTTETLTPKS